VYWDTTGTPAWAVGQTGIHIGIDAGKFGQGGKAIALGYNAGSTGQGNDAIAIGTSAGLTGQGANAIAIGNLAGATGQFPSSIVLNASGAALNAGTTGFFVAPVRILPSGSPATFNTLLYDAGSNEVVLNANATADQSKSFIIDHPLDPVNKHLIHVCLEGPESGVYYRGKGEIVNGTSVEIQLPAYVGALCTDLTVQITRIYDGAVKVFNAGEVDTATNTFMVYGENGRFNWLVHGKRGDVTVEPNKADVTVRGDGPYKYLV
jgi:hypothetical protein